MRVIVAMSYSNPKIARLRGWCRTRRSLCGGATSEGSGPLNPMWGSLPVPWGKGLMPPEAWNSPSYLLQSQWYSTTLNRIEGAGRTQLVHVFKRQGSLRELNPKTPITPSQPTVGGRRCVLRGIQVRRLTVFNEENLKHFKNEMHFRQVVLKLAKRLAVVHVSRNRCQNMGPGHRLRSAYIGY